MRLLVLICSSLIISSFGFADGILNSTGDAAAAVLSALQRAGAYVDCGAGTCGTEAQKLQCTAYGDNVRSLTYACNFIASNDSGNQVPMKAENEAAHALWDSLLNAGLAPSCDAGDCAVQAQDIQCLIHGNASDQRTYECAITPALTR